MTTSAAVGLDAFTMLVEGLDHPECVAVSPDGVLHAGGEAGQIYRVDLERGTVREVANTGGFVLGISFDGQGRLYACDIARHQLLRIELSDGRVDVYSEGTAEHPLVTPNLGCFAPDGSVYLTDSGTWHGNDGRIFRVDPRGRTETWCESSTEFPNGCCLDVDGGSLLVAESTAPALTRIPILADGSAGAREVVTELRGAVPDGVCVDGAGTAVVCCYRPDRIYAVSPNGETSILADDPEGTLLSAPTNAAWYGDGNRLLAVANLGRWHLSTADLGVRGHPPHLPVLPS
jgi:gluconolactonase